MKIIDYEVITAAGSLKALEDWLEIFQTIRVCGQEDCETGDMVFRVSRSDLEKLNYEQVERFIVAVRLAAVEEWKKENGLSECT